ncbi:MAG: nicotinate phosphoribosyltransferase [Myxococcaceae bacterium]|nr:nicotinate phosphoribosyltransferase [Myxococcaceae bacterium]
MSASWFAHRQGHSATFDLFVRKLPEQRNFLIACGLDQALHFLETFRFSGAAIDALRGLKLFDAGFLEWLGRMRFTGEVWAVPEGEAVFGAEPLLRVTAPLPEAQLVESFLLNAITFQTMIATKAARLAIACGGRRGFVDFSLRRDHGPTAALLGARAAWVGGAAATSNVLAAMRYGIPPSGTMAHSYVMGFDEEADAFRQFARAFRDRAVFLIDTWDTIEGARKSVQVARELKAEGIDVSGVRIDSGELAADARAVRRMFDEAGLANIQIVLSGDLDEHAIAKMVRDDVPADWFGVGTQLGTSADAPALGGVYKLAEEDGTPRMKLSRDKVTLPGRKQVFRFDDWSRDVIGLHDERIDGARPLLRCVMRDGRRVPGAESAWSLADARARCARTLKDLPEGLKALDRKVDYPVELSERLKRELEEVKARLHRG